MVNFYRSEWSAWTSILWFVFMIYADSDDVHTQVPLLAMTLNTDPALAVPYFLNRLEEEVEECCAKVFSHFFVEEAQRGNPCRTGFVTRRLVCAEAIAAIIQHAPDVLKVWQNEYFDCRNRRRQISVAASLVTCHALNLARLAPDDSSPDARESKRSLQLILDLSDFDGEEFDFQVEAECKFTSFESELAMKIMKDVLVPYRRTAVAWRRRMFWINTCVQLGMSD